ncbi:MAG: aldolase/citrate lyase family protein [Actinomycetota bacterium]|nr:aldolase/citrate lyase family protein [Actinomycetota bacterium]
MAGNPLRAKLAAGQTILGLMCFEFSTSGVARLAGAAGADFVMFDMEHTGWGIDTMRQLLATARGTGVTSLVRVPAAERQFVSPVLDLGALGVMVPQMESAGDARRLVEFARFHPGGTRGVGVYYPDAMPDGLAAALALANREQLLIAQIETAAGVEAAHEIAAVEGIDLLWIGHFDLSTSLGAPGEFGNPRHTAAVERVFAAAAAAGKPVGALATGVADARALLSQGYRALVYGDSLLFTGALREALDALR